MDLAVIIRKIIRGRRREGTDCLSGIRKCDPGTGFTGCKRILGNIKRNNISIFLKKLDIIYLIVIVIFVKFR